MIYTLGIQQVYKDGHLIDAEGYEYDGKRLKIARHGRPQAITTGDLENILAHPEQQSLLGRLHKCHSDLHRVRRHVRHTHRRRRRHRHPRARKTRSRPRRRRSRPRRRPLRSRRR